MPMSRDTKIEIVQRLQTAHKKTKKILEMEPVTRELHPGTDIARNWTVITASYSGLEQTIKYLIAEEKGLTIAELVTFVDRKDLNGNKGSTKKYPFQTHNLGWLFSKLEGLTQDVVRDFYGRYKSLHSYLNIGRVDQFLNAVSGRKGVGYQRWRYTLIEDKPLPRNSPEALLAIWDVCVRIAYGRVWENQQIEMPDKKLAQEFCERLVRLYSNVSVERQNGDEPYQYTSRELRDWLWRGGHPLNAFAEVLWHYSRFGCHGAKDVSEWLSETLTRWVKEVIEDPAVSRQTSLRAFVTRTQGHTPGGTNLRWNPKRNRFEAVRWTLKSHFQDALPAQAAVIAGSGRRGSPLTELWVAAKESGYRVVENRAFKGPPDQDIWFRTIEVRNEDAGKKKPILSIWEERKNYRELFYLVEECAPEEMGLPIRHWIDLARNFGKMRTNASGAS